MKGKRARQSAAIGDLFGWTPRPPISRRLIRRGNDFLAPPRTGSARNDDAFDVEKGDRIDDGNGNDVQGIGD